jgi:WD40 repeat protein
MSDRMKGERKPGQIITFYSYKGGTGRSMALANVATLLANRPEPEDKGERSQTEDRGRVLMVDWDLEAPGLHRYFRDNVFASNGRKPLAEKNVDSAPGLIDLFEELDAHTVVREKVGEPEIRRLLERAFKKIQAGEETQLDVLIQSEVKPKLFPKESLMSTRDILAREERNVIKILLEKIGKRNHAGLERFVREEMARVVLDEVKPEDYALATKSGPLYLLKAGRFDPNYSSRVNNFNWAKLYEKSPFLISAFAERLASHFRYVLIDSRTGETDISGICTRLLPEKLVVVFTPNRQSLLGVLGIIQKSTDYRRRSADERKLMVYPLPSRIELSEDVLRKQWRTDRHFGYQPLFETLFRETYELKRCDLKNYFNKVQIRHASSFAYGETIAVSSNEPDDDFSLTNRYTIFTDILANGEVPWAEKSAVEVRETIKRMEEENTWARRLSTPAILLAAGLAVVVVAILYLLWWKAQDALIVASARNSEDPLVAALLLLELNGHPEPEGGAAVARAVAESAIPRLVLRGHTESVNAVAVSPDGKLIATASSDMTVRLWNADTGAEKGPELKLSPTRPTGLQFNPEGTVLAVSQGDASSGNGDNVARLKSVPELKPVLTLSDLTLPSKLTHYGPVNSVVFSPDGRLLLTASDDFTAKVWEVTTGKLLTILPGSGSTNGHQDIVTRAKFSPNGKTIVTTCNDGRVRLWEANTGRFVKYLRAYSKGVNSADFSHNGRYVVTGSNDGTTRIWDLNSEGSPLILKESDAPVYDSVFSPDDELVASATVAR